MFERYTENARRVIFFARYEASQFGAATIEPEHLLLGILREDKALMSRVFPRAPLSFEETRKAVESRHVVREKFSTSVELPLAPETKRVLAYAHEESDRLQHRHIGTEHLLLGLLREERSMAAEILYERGLRLNAVRDKIARQTETETSTEQPQKGRFRSSFNQGVWSEEIRRHALRLMIIANELQNEEEHTTLSNEAAQGVDIMKGDPFQLTTSPGIKMAGQPARLTLGLEKFLRETAPHLQGARIGLICNQSSVDHQLRHAADLLYEQRGLSLTTLFGPQHGIRGDVQDNMVETDHAIDSVTGLPIYSLYSETREPTEEMLKDVDVLVFDMQDVGCRIYTFVYTLANCMRAAKKFGKRVIVCDRPNPINGVSMAGTVLEPQFASFVGQFPLPTRHGMTVGELALMFKDNFGLDCELEIVKLDGWSRDQWLDQTDAPWVLPSPNMPTLTTATVFPGTVHLEGTQMSEGRGTTRPFELIGAPYIEAADYARRLNGIGFEGVYFRACGFQPTFQKHAQQTCGGVQIHVTNRDVFEPYIAGVATVKLAWDLYGEHFKWKEPPYEYVFDKNPFDVIAGTDKLRAAIERSESLESIRGRWDEALNSFGVEREHFLLY